MATGEPAELQKENWQQHQTSVLSTFHYLYQSKVFSDVAFIIEDGEKIQKRYFAHKFLLSTRSVVFESMFSCTKDTEIIISDITSQGFETMLRFIYTDNLDLSSFQQASEAFCAAKKYALPFMEKQCQDYISSKITTESVCQIYELISKTEMSKVIYQCLIKISKNPKEVLKSPGFINSKWTTVQMIAKRSNMDLNSEYDLLNAIIQWGKEECIRQNLDIKNNLRSIIESFFPYIRFLAMYPLEYAKVVDDTDLFEIGEAFPILLKLLLPKATISLPKYLNCKMTTRNFSHYFTCRPFLSRDLEPSEILKENDIFVIKFQILNADIFLLGITLSALQQNQCVKISKLKTSIQINLLNSNKTEEYLIAISLHKFKEPFLAFPYPVQITEGETVNIKAQIQNIDKSSPMSIYKYQELVIKFQENEAEFLFCYENIDETIETHQISSLHYYI